MEMRTRAVADLRMPVSWIIHARISRVGFDTALHRALNPEGFETTLLEVLARDEQDGFDGFVTVALRFKVFEHDESVTIRAQEVLVKVEPGRRPTTASVEQEGYSFI